MSSGILNVSPDVHIIIFILKHPQKNDVRVHFLIHENTAVGLRVVNQCVKAAPWDDSNYRF